MKHDDIELKDTVDLMNSSDYKDQFIAEYRQTKIRFNKLAKLLNDNNSEKLDFELSCPVEVLAEQLLYMGEYLRCLETRAEIEGIKIN